VEGLSPPANGLETGDNESIVVRHARRRTRRAAVASVNGSEVDASPEAGSAAYTPEKSGRRDGAPSSQLVYLLLLLVFVSAAVGVFQVVNGRLADAASVEQMDRILETTSTSVSVAMVDYIADVDRAVAHLSSDLATTDINDGGIEQVLRRVLQLTPQLSGAYVADSEGAFVFVFRTADGFRTKRISVGADGGGVGRTVGFTGRDDHFVLRDEWTDPSDDYDPRTRPWYKLASVEGAGNVWTEPYTFFTSQRPGTTRALMVGSDDDPRVIGVDVELSQLVSLIDETSDLIGGEVFVLSGASVLTRHGLQTETVPPNDRVKAALEARRSQHGAERVEYRRGEDRHLGRFTPVGQTEGSWIVGVELSQAEVIGPVLGAFSAQRLLAWAIGVSLGVALVGSFVPIWRRIRLLERQSTTDSLTGLLNRREILRLGGVYATAGVGFALAVVEVDDFTTFVDANGDEGRDTVLRQLARRLDGVGGQVGRLGDDSFAILYPPAARHDYFNQAEHARTQVADAPFETTTGKESLTVSIGVAVAEPGVGADFDDVVARAHAAVFVAKESGRNRTIRATNSGTRTRRTTNRPDLLHRERASAVPNAATLAGKANRADGRSAEGGGDEPLTEVALLDTNGVVISVNEAWRRFRHTDGATPGGSESTEDPAVVENSFGAAVGVELFGQLRSNYVWHIGGSLATVVAMATLLFPTMNRISLGVWLSLSIASCASMWLSYRRLDALPKGRTVDRTLISTAAMGVMVGAFPWFDLNVVRQPDTVFLVCVCVMAFAAGSLVNLSPLKILIRVSLVPSLGALAAALVTVGENVAAACIVVFLGIVATRRLSTSFDRVIELVRVREEALVLATVDPLTGALNRRGFFERDLLSGALLLLDLDGFKHANDTLGHAAGDDVLIETVRRITVELRAVEHVIGRLGGDEFVVAFGLHGEAAREMSEQIVNKLRMVTGNTVVTVSAGLVSLAHASADHDEVIARADYFLYRAKASGGNCVVSSALTETTAVDFNPAEQSADALRTSLQNGEVVAHLQPLVDARTERIVGFEALGRWHRDGTIVPAKDFFTCATEANLLPEVTRAVARDIVDLMQRRPPGEVPMVSVNVEAGDLAAFLEWIQRQATDPRKWVVEVTESQILTNYDAAATALADAAAIGIRVLLDDFGTGYSSLTRILRLPIHGLKIDASFIQATEHNPTARAIVASVVQLAEQCDLLTIAEGVETAAQVACLRDYGINLMQGYYFYRPANIDMTDRLIDLSSSSRPFAGLTWQTAGPRDLP